MVNDLPRRSGVTKRSDEMPEDTLAKKAIRPARQDDICILLYSNDLEENAFLRGSQAILQGILGGRVVTPVHLTSHRFEGQDDKTVLRLVQNLADRLENAGGDIDHRGCKPFPITALSYVPLYSAFREVNLLKWRIRTSVELYQYTMLVDEVLSAIGIPSIFPEGWVSSLVTALEDIPELCSDRQELNQKLQSVQDPLPRQLFTANEIALSRVKGPEEFEILERIAF
jgi:hypothetical protein